MLELKACFWSIIIKKTFSPLTYNFTQFDLQISCIDHMFNKSNTIWRELWVFRCCNKHFPLTLSWKCTHWQESAWDILVNMLLLIFIVILGWTFSVCVCACCAFSVNYEIWANPLSSPHHLESGLFFSPQTAFRMEQRVFLCLLVSIFFLLLLSLLPRWCMDCLLSYGVCL